MPLLARPALVILVFSLFPLPLNAQTAPDGVFMSNLTLGSTGQEVLLLQELLNRDPETQVAQVGTGSPGNETTYFGALTKAAVIRFQNKYASEVLSPAGLLSGSGYVGAYTRSKLNTVFSLATTPAPPPVTVPSAVPAPTSPPPSAVAPANRISTNVDLVLAAIDKAASEQGYSADQLAKAKRIASEQLSTSTDLVGKFLATAPGLKNPLSLDAKQTNFLGFFTNAIASVFYPRHAFAAAASVPFGALLKSVIACNGGVFNLYFSPLPPSYAVTLSYVSGSQAFLSYNIPFTPSLLGFYVPGPGSCVVGNVPVPSEGIITPVVGSAPL